MADTWKTIEPTEGDFTPVWNFEENKELIGVLTEKKDNVGPNSSTLYTFDLKDGEQTSVWASALLKDRFSSIEIGTEVRIVFNGLKDGKNGRQYRDYTVQTK